MEASSANQAQNTKHLLLDCIHLSLEGIGHGIIYTPPMLEAHPFIGCLKTLVYFTSHLHVLEAVRIADVIIELLRAVCCRHQVQHGVVAILSHLRNIDAHVVHQSLPLVASQKRCSVAKASVD